MEPTIRSNEPGPIEVLPPVLFKGPAVRRAPRVRAPAARRAAAAAAQAAAAPRWAVLAVKGCVGGILLLPLAAPAVLAASDSFLGASAAETFRMVGSPVAVVLWLALVGGAHALIGRFPPVARR
ncbi:MAG: hypothetical protein HZB56_03650 [Deltaproteobacteria bacterium]|nr:hypothetical protein [Deltaproteobacteria bacterium]